MKILKKLRALTYAPLSDCKRALEESGSDIEKAQERLKERGAVKAAKNADRETNEGIVVVTNDDSFVVGLKLACETDFVAKNDIFKSLAKQINDKVRSLSREISSISDLTKEEISELNKVLQDNFVTVGENMKIVDVFSTHKISYIYTHGGSKLSAVVFYEGDESVAKNVALQIAAMNPTYFSMKDVPTQEAEDIKLELKEELKGSDKSEAIVDKIIAGRLDKHFSELVLLEQSSIVDDSRKVKDILGDTEIHGYIRYSI